MTQDLIRNILKTILKNDSLKLKLNENSIFKFIYFLIILKF